MILHLYRIQYKEQVSFAVLREDRFYFVDVRNPQMPVSAEKSAPSSECKILNPTQPTKIIGVGLNYKDHAEERNKPIPSEPLLFIKPSTALVAHEEKILLPPVSKRVDPEGELAIIIGRQAHLLSSPDDADRFIFGYSCFNDVTARDLQDKDVQFTRAKGFDTFAPFGPCVAIGVDPKDLAIQTRVNGQVRQSSRTNQLIFNSQYLVWYISQIMTLMPGDVISTGTPSGIAPIYDGDTVEIEIESVGLLRNTVKRAE
jgi:2-keto-4-pentenoate hydratase/2-oxohepta-3-ene-1,7-dioic acid hydratase in catechol pathway